MTSTLDDTDTLARRLGRGAVAGMAASMMMAMFAMIASVTYQHHGFFTPLFHISALTGTPSSMMTSVQQAMAGHRFWFTPGAAVVGAMIHMMAGAMFGALFSLAASKLPRRSLPAAGAMFGLAAFVMSAHVLLPIAAKITGSGTTISEMASMVGFATFAVEHVLFGMTLGAIVWALARRTTTVERGAVHRPAAAAA